MLFVFFFDFATLHSTILLISPALIRLSRKNVQHFFSVHRVCIIGCLILTLSLFILVLIIHSKD